DDYMRFKGGALSFLDDPIDTGQDELSDFFRNQDIKFRKTEFGAVNLSQDLSSTLRLEAYSLASYQKEKTQSINEVTYLTGNSLEEEREDQVQNKDFTSLTKAKLRYRPTDKLDMEYNAVL